MSGGREREAVRKASFTIGFDINEITQIGLFTFMEEIVSNRYDFVLDLLFDLEPMKNLMSDM